jgi:hypothetical protein
MKTVGSCVGEVGSLDDDRLVEWIAWFGRCQLKNLAARRVHLKQELLTIRWSQYFNRLNA